MHLLHERHDRVRWLRRRHRHGVLATDNVQYLNSRPAEGVRRSGAGPVQRLSALRAAGVELLISARPREPSVDESLIRQQLTLTPAERLDGLEVMYREARALSDAGASDRAELA